MEDSILTSVKKMLGLSEEYTHFDLDIILHINTVLNTLNQIGAGINGFTISDKTSTWQDFMGDRTDLEFVKSYVYLKVRMIFDPPQSASLMEAVNKSIAELEWRISVTVDPGGEVPNNG